MEYEEDNVNKVRKQSRIYGERTAAADERKDRKNACRDELRTSRRRASRGLRGFL
jgi:hypothetical protein